MMIRFCDGVTPASFELPLLLTTLGLEVATATKALVVNVWLRVLLPLVTTTMEVTSLLLLITDLDKVTAEPSDCVEVILRDSPLVEDVDNESDEGDDVICD